MMAVWYSLLSLILMLGYLGLLYVPGYLLFCIFGARGAIARGASPIVSIMCYTVIGITFDWFSLPWRLLPVLGALTIVVLIAFILSRLPRFKGLLSVVQTDRSLYALLSFRRRALAITALLLLTILVTGNAASIPQHTDSIFHLNGVWTITKTGNGSILSALSSLFSLQPVSVSYPSVWHPFVALLARPSTVVLATNASLMMLPIIWLHTMSVFVDTVFYRDRSALPYLPLIIFITPIAPTVVTHLIDRWPNAFGITVLPGLLAISVHVLRRYLSTRAFDLPHRFVGLYLLLFLWVGVALAHPSTPITLIVMLLPVLLHLVVRLSRNVSCRRIKKRTIRHFQILTAITVLIVFVASQSVISRLQAGAPDFIVWSDLFTKIGSLLSVYTYWSASVWGDITIGFVSLFTITGVVRLIRKKQTQWLVVCYIFFFVICAGSLVFIPIATQITALWFSDPLRLIAFLSILAIPLATQGLHFYAELVSGWIETKVDSRQYLKIGNNLRIKSRVLLVLLLVFALGGLSVTRVTLVSRLYDPPSPWHMQQLGPGEIELHHRLKTELNPEYLVLGEAANGSGLLPITAGIPVALKHQNYSNLDQDGWYLRQRFADLRTDPSICKLINRHQIKYYYEDPTIRFSEHNLRERSPGLFNVDTSQGFTLVDQSAEVKVWKIDVCDKKPLPLPFIKVHP